MPVKLFAFCFLFNVCVFTLPAQAQMASLAPAAPTATSAVASPTPPASLPAPTPSAAQTAASSSGSLAIAATPAATPTATAAPAAQPTHSISGILFERGTKTPLSDVNVFILPYKLKAVTDAKGHFQFDTVPEGPFTFIVNAANYQRLEKLDENKTVLAAAPRRLYLQRMSYDGFETTVKARAEKRDDTTKTMDADQFLTMPGAGGDPVKAVQNLPGIARTSGSANVIIQGSAPQDTQYLVDQQSVPLIFHFDGLTSIVTPEAISQIDYLAAGYGPEYGRAMGGIIGLTTRSPATDRTKGFVFVDTMKSGGLIEGPIDDKSSFLISGRYSYIGLLLPLILKNNDQLSLTVAPSYSDITGVYEYRLSDRDQFKITALGSHDELSFLFKEPSDGDPTIRGAFDNETDFYRIIPQWTHKHSEATVSRWSLGLGQDILRVDFGDNYLRTNQYIVSQRGEVETQVNPLWKTYIGLDNQFGNYQVNAQVPASNSNGGVSQPISTSAVRQFTSGGPSWQLAPYWRNSIRLGPNSNWTLLPSARVDYFSQTKEVLPAPRLAARYKLDEVSLIKAATGLYYQPPQVQETDSSYGNPDLKSPFALHYTVGYERDFRKNSDQGFRLDTDVFYRDYHRLVISTADTVQRDGTTVPEVYNNDGTGRSYGLEVLLKYDHKAFSGFLSYTLSKSTRATPQEGSYLFQYDQTNNINLVGQYNHKNNLKISGRVRYVTGNPYTPVVSATFDADNDVYIPKAGDYYSTRLSPFFEVDARIDKKWIYDRYILWGYLDIENLTNHGNPESIIYSYNYAQKKEITGLPILPTLGIQGEF